LKRELLYKFEPTADIVNQPCPRTWAALGRKMNLGLPRHLEFPAFVGSVGEGAATEFLASLKIMRSMPALDSIILNPTAAPIPDSPDGRFAVASGRADMAKNGNFGRISEYSERMRDAGHGEIAVFTVLDATKRDKKLENTAAYVNAMAGRPIGELIRA